MSPKRLPEEEYAKLSNSMARIAERRGVPTNDVQDVVQDAWVRAFTHDNEFQGEHAFSELLRWLCTIVRNIAVDTHRGHKRRPHASLQALAAEPMDKQEAKRQRAAECRDCLNIYLARLLRENPDNWSLVCEHYLNGRSIRDLAEEENWSANQISCRISRSIRQMRSWGTKFCAYC